jgi:hypothetical protein
MLFDLRSRGRRRVVRVIYLFLAILMLGGLVLFGVGAGNGFGGLLNAFTNNGSGGGGSSVVSSAQKAAIKATRANPTSSAAWAGLVQADFDLAGQGSNFNSTTNAYDASGKKILGEEVVAWQQYQKLVKTPSDSLATLAAESYGVLGQYANAADAWQAFTLSEPSEAKGYECWGLTAAAAKQTRTAALAQAKALSLVPKLDRLQLKQLFTAAKTEPSIAQQEC